MEQTQTQEKALSVLDDYSVVVDESKGLQQFFMDGENLQKVADHIEKTARGLVADPNTKEGASQIKAAARQIASVKRKVDDIGKDVVASLKKLPDIIDGNRKAFRERLEALQEEIRRPVTEIEERKKAIEDIKGTHFNCANMDSAALVQKIKTMEEEMGALNAEVWKESYDDAVAAYKSEIGALNVMKGAAEKREKEQRELEELRKNKEESERIIRENKIREEAKEQGKKEAIVAMASMTQVEIVDSNGVNEVPPVSSRPAPVVPMHETIPQPKPSKWTPEMKEINNAIVKAIATIIEEKLKGFTEQGYELAAKQIVKAILTGKINNVKVEY